MSYDIYCLSESIRGNVLMSNSDMLQTRTVITTECCIPIEITLSKSVLEVSGIPSLDFLTVLATTTRPVSVQVVVFKIGSMFSSTDCMLSPRYLELNSNNGIIQVGLSRCMEGRYSIQASVDDGYVVTFSNGNYFDIVESFSTVPMMNTAVFTNDFTALMVYFDVPTNRVFGPGSFACSLLLDFSNVGNSTCSWTSSTSLRVGFSYGSILAPGDYVTIPFPGNLTTNG